MPLFPTAFDLGLRIVLTLVAAGAIGFERGQHGKAAGLRTTLLVALAACLAMIQVNLLLPVEGKTESSFAVMDVMRLPLGILTGVGFIGAGSILKRGAVVVGVTTAATLWFVTVIGLLFGGGQLGLGIAGSILGFGIIEALRRWEARLPRDRHGQLKVSFDRTRIEGEAMTQMVAAPPFELLRTTYDLALGTQTETRRFYLRWRSRDGVTALPGLVRQIAAQDGVLAVHWDGDGLADS